jgi:polyhydroxybutyrate depolymerase
VHRYRPIAVVAALALALGACGASDDAGQAAPTTTAPQADDATTSTTVAPRPTTGDAPARPSAGCDAGPAAEVALGETTDEVIDVDGLERTWRQHVPASYDGTTPMPVVIQLHGLTQPHTTVEVMAGFEALGEEEGFIVLTPAGRVAPVPLWAATTSPDNPDLAFFPAMLDAVSASLCVDEARVYSSGISNGGLMSFALACALSDRLAAVAPVAGVVLPEPCDLSRPVPIVAFYGDADAVLPFNGRLGEALGNVPGVGSGDAPATTAAPGPTLPSEPIPTIPDKIAAWAAHLACEEEPTVERVADEVRLESWTDCDGDAELRFYVVEGGGHTWPGSASLVAAQSSNDGDARVSIMGHTTDQIVATELAWEFFTQHALTD